jgi:hypothetical protein
MKESYWRKSAEPQHNIFKCCVHIMVFSYITSYINAYYECIKQEK